MCYFPHKYNVHSVHPNKYSCTDSGLHTKQQNNLLYTVRVKQNKTKQNKNMMHPVFCFGLATAPHPHHKQCFPLLQNRRAHLLSFYAKALIANCKTV